MLDHANEQAADALRELGNIAFSHAATALAMLVRRRVDISIPSVRVLEKRAIEQELATRDESLYVVAFRLAGDQTGIVAVLFPQPDAAALVKLLTTETATASEDLGAEGEETLQEIGNIMAGSALLAMNRMLGTTLLHSTPSFYRRTAPQLIEDHVFAAALVLVVEAEFTVEDRHSRGTMIVSPNSPEPILSRLGVLPGAPP